MSDCDREWHRLTSKLRRRLRREERYLVVTRGHAPQMMIFNIRPGFCEAGPVSANMDRLRRWLED